MQRMQGQMEMEGLPHGFKAEALDKEKALPEVPKGGRPMSAGSAVRPPPGPPPGAGHKAKGSLGNLGRLTSGIGPRRMKRT